MFLKVSVMICFLVVTLTLDLVMAFYVEGGMLPFLPLSTTLFSLVVSILILMVLWRPKSQFNHGNNKEKCLALCAMMILSGLFVIYVCGTLLRPLPASFYSPWAGLFSIIALFTGYVCCSGYLEYLRGDKEKAALFIVPILFALNFVFVFFIVVALNSNFARYDEALWLGFGTIMLQIAFRLLALSLAYSPQIKGRLFEV